MPPVFEEALFTIKLSGFTGFWVVQLYMNALAVSERLS